MIVTKKEGSKNNNNCNSINDENNSKITNNSNGDYNLKKSKNWKWQTRRSGEQESWLTFLALRIADPTPSLDRLLPCFMATWWLPCEPKAIPFSTFCILGPMRTPSPRTYTILSEVKARSNRALKIPIDKADQFSLRYKHSCQYHFRKYIWPSCNPE